MKRIALFVAVFTAAVLVGRSTVYRAAGEIWARQAEKPGIVKVRLKVTQAKKNYTLDAEVKDSELQKLSLPEGGEARFRGCTLNDNLHGSCLDTDSRSWDIAGTSWR